MANKETLKLKYPITLADEVVIKELHFDKRMKGKHLRSITDCETELEQGLALLASMTGVEPEIIDEMDEYDVRKGIEIIKKNKDSQTPDR